MWVRLPCQAVRHAKHPKPEHFDWDPIELKIQSAVEEFYEPADDASETEESQCLVSKPTRCAGPETNSMELWGVCHPRCNKAVGKMSARQATEVEVLQNQLETERGHRIADNRESRAEIARLRTELHIAKTEAMIALEERALVEHPEARDSILLHIASLAKVKRQLVEEQDKKKPPSTPG